MISVVVPCYNVEKTIDRCVQSLISQCQNGSESLEVYQVVLVDDGSIDNTSCICDKYQNDFPYSQTLSGNKENRVYISTFHQPNGGLVNAWKRGVIEAKGDYILFCDADDSVEDNWIQNVYRVINQNSCDLILFGIEIDYNYGKSTKVNHRLKPGLYNRDKIREDIFPNLFSNGDMQSELILKSRSSKAFRKEILLSIFDDLDDSLTVAEDALTTFAAVIKSNSIYMMDDFYPYHYLRNDESMIGGYDPYIFDKLSDSYKRQYVVAKKYGYEYGNQLLMDHFSYILIYIKKEICRFPGGRRDLIERIQEIRERKDLCDIISNISINNYSISSRVFAWLFINRYYKTLIILTRWMAKDKR